jgi:outer membrane protein
MLIGSQFCDTANSSAIGRSGPGLFRQPGLEPAARRGSRRCSAWRPTATATGQFGYNYLDLRLGAAARAALGIPATSSTPATRFRAGTDLGTLGLNVTQNLFNGNRTANAVRQAESNIFGARETLRSTEQNILLSAATASI